MKWRKFIAREWKAAKSAVKLKAKKETALSLAEMGLPVEKIAKAVNHNVKDVQKWIDETLCVTK